MTKPDQILKASGVVEPYRVEKLRESLERAGAKPGVADQTLAYVEEALPPEATTEHIFACSLKRLRDLEPSVAARYSLKRGIASLGPSGYLFERFIAAILDEHGYQTQVGTMIKGFCVEHEVDVLARKDDQQILIECKYHNQPGVRSDVKVALYTGARFDDVVRGLQYYQGKEGYLQMVHEAWLVTNTKCTSQAIQYALCRGLRILAWRYPASGGLEKMIESKGLYPLTVLPSLSRTTLQTLAKHDMMLVRDLCGQPSAELVRRFGLKEREAANVARDAAQLCS